MPSDNGNRLSPLDTTAVLLAAGEGQRAGLGRSKAFLVFGGRTLLDIDLERVSPFCARRLVGLRADDMDRARDTLVKYGAEAIEGGAERIDTVANLLGCVSSEFVLVYDVARPFVPAGLLERLMAGLGDADGAAPVVRLTLRDSLALIDDNDGLEAVLPRSQLVMTQGPHLFRTAALADSVDQARRGAWNEVSLMAVIGRAGLKMAAVAGDPENIKVTYPEDLERLTDT